MFDSARDLFYKRGVRAVGVDEIVAEAGVTKPSLYRAYASKDDLVAACLLRSSEETCAEIDAMLECAPSDPRCQLEALMAHYANMLRQPNFRGCALSNVAVEFPEPGHPARAVAETSKAAFRQRILDLTRALGIRDPDELADGLVLLLEGAMASHHLFGSQGPSSAMLGTAQRLIASHVDEVCGSVRGTNAT